MTNEDLPIRVAKALAIAENSNFKWEQATQAVRDYFIKRAEAVLAVIPPQPTYPTEAYLKHGVEYTADTILRDLGGEDIAYRDLKPLLMKAANMGYINAWGDAVNNTHASHCVICWEVYTETDSPAGIIRSHVVHPADGHEVQKYFAE